MEKGEIAGVKMLANRFNLKERLFPFFSPKDEENLRESGGTFSSDFSSLLSSKGWSVPIHYSWFYEELKSYPKELQENFLSLLTPEQNQRVSELLKIPKNSKKLSPFASTFLMHFLKKQMEKNEEVLFLEGLEDSEMNVLLTIGKKELMHVVDLLGIYDLAADLRQIVDKELLSKIYAALSREKLQFLHYATRQPMKWVSPKLNLERWNGAKKTLEHLLHQRGLIRLSRAILDESSDYKWHFLHHVDTGRAKFMQKIFSQEIEPSLVNYFKGQVLHILERFRAA